MYKFMILIIIVTVIISLSGCTAPSYDDGYIVGFQEGYEQGWEDGYQKCSDEVESFFSQLELPNIDFPDIKLPDMELPDVEFPDIEFPDVEIPDIELPNIEFPDVEIPDIEFPSETTTTAIMVILPIEKRGDSYYYHTVLEEKSGVYIHFTALTREFVNAGYVWTGGRDFLLDRVGSFTLPANGTLEWETAFDIYEAQDYFNEHGELIYRECWYGTDANGNAVGICFSISTSDF